MPQTKKYSWPLVIVLVFLFFPVGIPMLVVKVNSEKHLYCENARVMKIFGWILAAMGVFYLVMGITGSLETEAGGTGLPGIITALMLFGGGGVLLIVSAARLMKKGIRYKRYPVLIASMEGGKIDEIAEKMRVSSEQVRSDLQQMIDCGLLSGVFFDPQADEVMLQGISRKEIRVSCPSCGAVNLVREGKKVLCEYCKLPL